MLTLIFPFTCFFSCLDYPKPTPQHCQILIRSTNMLFSFMVFLYCMFCYPVFSWGIIGNLALYGKYAAYFKRPLHRNTRSSSNFGFKHSKLLVFGKDFPVDSAVHFYLKFSLCMNFISSFSASSVSSGCSSPLILLTFGHVLLFTK